MTSCPDGHPARHVAVVVPLVEGFPVEVVHYCGESHEWTGPLTWRETANDPEAVLNKVRKTLDGEQS